MAPVSLAWIPDDLAVADFSAQAVVNTILMREFPNDPIVGEEDSKDLRAPEGATLREKVIELANSVLPTPRTAEEVRRRPAASETRIKHDSWLSLGSAAFAWVGQLLAAIDYGNYAGGAKGRFWTLDPIDGTKGFLRGEQFAVCLALVVDGVVQVGVMGCPNLPVRGTSADATERGCLFVAVTGQHAFQVRDWTGGARGGASC